MKKRNLLLISSVIVVFVIMAPLALANDFDIEKFFIDKETKLESIDASIILVQGESFTITVREFVDHKANLEIIYDINSMSSDVTNEEVIDQMLENKLLLRMADEQGVEASAAEVQEYALQTKKAFQENTELNQINLELAKQLNVSPEDYFTHPNVLKQYEEVVKINNLVTIMALEGEINDDYTINEFVEDIKAKDKDTFKVDKQVLKKFE